MSVTNLKTRRHINYERYFRCPQKTETEAETEMAPDTKQSELVNSLGTLLTSRKWLHKTKAS